MTKSKVVVVMPRGGINISTPPFLQMEYAVK
jgi:hypothetical protein